MEVVHLHSNLTISQARPKLMELGITGRMHFSTNEWTTRKPTIIAVEYMGPRAHVAASLEGTPFTALPPPQSLAPLRPHHLAAMKAHHPDVADTDTVREAWKKVHDSLECPMPIFNPDFYD